MSEITPQDRSNPAITDRHDEATIDMPALTLWQPWASLIAEGVKVIETRSWAAPTSLIGERIAIHAAAKRPPDTWANETPSAPWLDLDVMAKHYLVDEASDVPGMFRHRWTGPLGAVVAIARLAACVPMAERMPAQDACPWPTLVRWRGFGSAEFVQTYADQIPYGDFAPGRWAWLLYDIEKLPEPVPAKGFQKVWRWSR